jgi:hypothetical protein
MTVFGNTFSRVGYTAISAQNGTLAIDNNVISGSTGAGTGVYLLQDSGSVTRNTIEGFPSGLYAFAARFLRVSGNTIRRGALTTGTSISVTDAVDSVAIVGNTIQRGLGEGIHLYGYTGIPRARVDSNTVQGMGGRGMLFDGSITSLSMRYNTLADNDVGLYSVVPVQGIFNTVARNATAGVSINHSAPSTFRRGTFVGNAHFALSNSFGAPPPVMADSSFWGDALGPRCAGPCNPAAVGDSVGQFVAFPPPAPALVDSAPPIPAPLPAGAPPALSGAPRASALPARPITRPAARPTPILGPRPAGVRP